MNRVNTISNDHCGNAIDRSDQMPASFESGLRAAFSKGLDWRFIFSIFRMEDVRNHGNVLTSNISSSQYVK
ncbi:hypothetical protein RJT34_09874 [Clitoria ternatea]|uniref:Uncharacterized protein n=1 Tax=Clitoria ternatea TaxID=43366 RepID=A0AAN9K8Q5_CLITE